MLVGWELLAETGLEAQPSAVLSSTGTTRISMAVLEGVLGFMAVEKVALVVADRAVLSGFKQKLLTSREAISLLQEVLGVRGPR